MATMSSAYILIGVFAVVGLFLKIEWLFFAMLLLLVALAAAASLERPPRVHKEKNEEKPHQKPGPFFDFLLANLIAGKYREDQEKQREKEKKKEEGAHGEKEKGEKKHGEHGH